MNDVTYANHRSPKIKVSNTDPEGNRSLSIVKGMRIDLCKNNIVGSTLGAIAVSDRPHIAPMPSISRRATERFLAQTY